MKLSSEDFSEPEQIGSSAESLQRSFDSQRELFHSQIDQLQRVVIVQCQLTGVNPLAQEMAAGALSIKIGNLGIGKRPRDLLNPKAVKYMQSIFSIKDAVTKKECREISALFGVTVTQVREFFATQRSRVRKLVTLSRERAIRSNSLLELQDENQTNFDPLVPINIVPLNTIDPTKDEEPPTCSTEDDVLSGIDDLDKQFVETIFSLMRKEETFSGQVKLMEWILRIQNSAVLCWFLSRGGIMILATWLSQAAAEEQTSFLLVILNVLCHLPLNKALPVHMSAILQNVNRLRFYKTSDISNRARVLLSNWSKSLARSQALKKPNGTKTFIDEQQELILKQSLSDVIADESWQSSIDAPENILGSSDDFWKSETTQVLRLLPASSDDPNKKLLLGASSSQTRERRKVQLVEQPGQKTAGRSPQATRAAASNRSRPMSADDIQKAKMRAQFMQSKYRKASESNTNKKLKTELLNNPSTSAISTFPPALKVVVQPKLEEQKQSVPLLPLKVPNPLEDSLGLNPRKDRKESLLEKCTRVQISWKTPSEIRLDHPWRVGAGENSKEVEIQRNRNRREKETVYRTVQEIPPNPKEPWDSEMDYDDSLTPVITIEQLPEAEGAVTQASPNPNPNPNLEPQNGVISNSRVSNVSTAEPDLELLAVLLKNPELVIALTSGQAANLPPTETMKLLDMIKVGASATVSSFNAANQKVEDKVEVSLPSPTPLIDPGTCAWRPEAVRNPFSQLNAASNNQSLPAMHFAPPQYSQQPKTMVQEKYSPLDGPRSNHKISLNTFSSVQTNSHSPSNSNVKLPSTNNSFANSNERFRVSGTATTSAAAAAHSKTGNHGPDFWRPGQNLPPNYSNSLSNQNISYNSESRGSYRGPGPAHVSQANGPQWDRNEYAAEGRSYESWSPDNSPTRNSRDYAMMGRNFPEPRMSYRSAADQSRARDSSNSGYTDYNNRYGDRKWRDRRR